MKSTNKRRNIVLKLLIGLLGLLGFSACEEERREMYGSPYATYNLKFQLTDEDNNPLGNTQLHINKDGQPLMRNIKTDSEGKIEQSIKDGGALILDGKNYLVYYEKDNEHHSGTFKEDSVKLNVTQIEEGKGWYEGTYELKATLKLKKK
ncbi:MAG: radical SAM-associated putative lipoprotein [Bacteroidales bacterium]|nr:radical SAM-associated putative lipoprotein [Bacteroidales bacterium]